MQQLHIWFIKLGKLNYNDKPIRDFMSLLFGILRPWGICLIFTKITLRQEIKQPLEIWSTSMLIMNFVNNYFSLSYFRCGTKLCDTKVHEKPSELFQHLNLGWVPVPYWEKNSDLYRFSHSRADRLHCLLAPLPERTQLPDLQDQTDADDHPTRGPHQDQECEQGATELELYISESEKEL